MSGLAECYFTATGAIENESQLVSALVSAPASCCFNVGFVANDILFYKILLLIFVHVLFVSTKLHIYSTCVLPILLYDSKSWTVIQADWRRLDSFYMQCQIS